MNIDLDSRIPGSLSRLEMDEDEREVFLDYMSIVSPKAYTDFIWSMLGDRNFMMFFDVLEGLQVKVPTRQNMAKFVNNIKIYCYLRARGATEESFEKAALIFKKRVTALKELYNKIDNTLTTGVSNEEATNDNTSWED